MPGYKLAEVVFPKEHRAGAAIEVAGSTELAATPELTTGVASGVCVDRHTCTVFPTFPRALTCSALPVLLTGPLLLLSDPLTLTF